jgi:hypothetical protein
MKVIGEAWISANRSNQQVKACPRYKKKAALWVTVLRR